MRRNPWHDKSVLGVTRKARAVILAAMVGACIGAVGCTVQTDVGDDLKELKEGQKAILERMEKLEKAQKEMLASWQERFPKRPSIDYDRVFDIEVGKSPVRGAKDAKVTLVEFSDFQCPYSRLAQPLLENLLKAYPDDLRHVYKNFPLGFHKEAMPAAKACLAAGLQGKFWEMQKVVFENPKNLSEADLKKYAGKVGLDLERFERDFKGEEVEKQVQEDLAAAKKAAVTGTPTLFLNGKRVRDRSEEAMKREIDGILAASKKS
jgi:protein-disulfide isomerase